MSTAKDLDKSASKDTKSKRCFVITPIGNVGTDIHRAAMGLLHSVIRPVFSSYGYEVQAAHEIADPGSINSQIVQRLLNDDFAVANLTGLNPNVMYELAIRHASKKPLICLAEENTQLPFDVKDERTIFYKNDMQGVQEIEPFLRKMVEAVNSDWNADNPVTRGSNNFKLSPKEIEETRDDLLLRRLKEIEDKLLLKSPITPSGNIEISSTYEYIVTIAPDNNKEKFKKFFESFRSVLRDLYGCRLYILNSRTFSVHSPSILLQAPLRKLILECKNGLDIGEVTVSGVNFSLIV